MNRNRPRVLFVSTMDLDREVDSLSQRKRWTGLSSRFDVETIGFSRNSWGSFTRHGCRFYALPRHGPLLLRLLVYYSIVPVLVFWRAFRGPASVWIAQSPYEALAVIVPRIVLGRIYGVKLIVEAHGDWIGSFLNLRSPPFPSLIRPLLRGLSRVILWFADGLRSVSDHTRGLMDSLTPHSPPHHTFPAFMDLEPFLKSTLEEKNRMEEDRPLLLYVGALTALKGVDLFLRTVEVLASEHNRLDAVLCGEGPARGRFTARAREMELGDRVTFLGYVDQPTLREQYLRAHVLVLPSRMEGYGRVLVEAMACFTPVVATPTGGARELITKSGGGRLTERRDHRHLTRAIQPYLRDRNLRRQDGSRGRSYVRRTFEPEGFVRGYQDLISEVSACHGDGSSP